MKSHFQDLLYKAIAKNANDFSLFQLRGFAYEMINLSWLERKLCNIFFAKVPECTVDEAIAGFSEIYFGCPLFPISERDFFLVLNIRANK